MTKIESTDIKETKECSPREMVVEEAKYYIGLEYIIGGANPDIWKGFDCSGFVQYVFARCGHDIPRTSHEQYLELYTRDLYTDEFESNEPKIGSILFNKSKSHVGIYIGNKEYIHAPHVGEKVKISKLEGSNMCMSIDILG